MSTTRAASVLYRGAKSLTHHFPRWVSKGVHWRIEPTRDVAEQHTYKMVFLPASADSEHCLLSRNATCLLPVMRVLAGIRKARGTKGTPGPASPEGRAKAFPSRSGSCSSPPSQTCRHTRGLSPEGKNKFAAADLFLWGKRKLKQRKTQVLKIRY